MDSDRRMLRLGEGVDRDCVLKVDAMTRVIETLREWNARIASHPVEATVVVATSAVRDAKNQQVFLDRIQREAGFAVEVLSGEEEARRTLLGIQFGLPSEVHSILGLDIGGGSTEFIRLSKKRDPTVVSLDLGVVRLAERCIHSDPPLDRECVEVQLLVRHELKRLPEVLKDLSDVTLVGTAGTVTTLAAMAQGLPGYDPVRVHNYRLSLEKVRELESVLCSCTNAARAQLPGLESGREKVIVVGAIILRTVMEALGFEHCLVSDYGLREGILVNLVIMRG